MPQFDELMAEAHLSVDDALPMDHEKLLVCTPCKEPRKSFN